MNSYKDTSYKLWSQNGLCIQCLVALVVAYVHKVIAKVAAEETYIYYIFSNEVCEGDLTDGFYGSKKIEASGEIGGMLIYSFSRLIPSGGIGWP